MSQRYKQRLLASSGYSTKKVQSEFGQRMLKMMGWTEGKGLGKTQDGISQCVQQRRRQEGQGLGVQDKKSFKWNDNWWDNVYTSAMKQFKNVKKSQSTSSSEESGSGSESDNSVAKFHKNKKNGKKEVRKEESEEESEQEKVTSVKTKKIQKKKIVIIKREKKPQKIEEESE